MFSIVISMKWSCIFWINHVVFTHFTYKKTNIYITFISIMIGFKLCMSIALKLTYFYINNFICKSTLSIKEILPKSNHLGTSRFNIQLIWGNHFKTQHVSPRIILGQGTSMVQWGLSLKRSSNQGHTIVELKILGQTIIQSYFGKQLSIYFSRGVFFQIPNRLGQDRFINVEASQTITRI